MDREKQDATYVKLQENESNEILLKCEGGTFNVREQIFKDALSQQV